MPLPTPLELLVDDPVQVRGLRMRYGTKEVLTGVDLDVHRGEVVCLLGPNGAGKTTTIEVLEGFRNPSAGAVRVLGVDPGRGTEDWRARTGVVLQSWRDHPRWTSRRLLAHLGAYYTPYSTSDRPRPYAVDGLLDMVGLAELADQKIATLSGGQRRRLDVAIGIVGRPELLFLDEPTAGFDPQARRDFHDLVLRLSQSEDTTILLTTHDLSEAEKLADRILILAGGRIVADGTPDDLAREVATEASVRWSVDGVQRAESTTDATRFVRALFERYGDAVRDLEVRRANLEDTYLAVVQQHEAGSQGRELRAFGGGDVGDADGGDGREGDEGAGHGDGGARRGAEGARHGTEGADRGAGGAGRGAEGVGGSAERAGRESGAGRGARDSDAAGGPGTPGDRSPVGGVDVGHRVRGSVAVGSVPGRVGGRGGGVVSRHAVRVGLGRGWTEFTQSVRSTQDQGFYLFTALLVLGYLFVNRDDPVEGTSLLYPSVAMPSILGGLLTFGVVIGPAYALAMEREDGTLLRAKAVPHGLTGYVTGQVLFQSLSLLPSLGVILLPGFLLFDGLMSGGATGWSTLVWVLLLGLVAAMPIGMVIGALVPSTQKVSTWGMLPVLGLAAISGIFVPVQALWGWVQVVAQIFPMYWIGLGMRSAFLPDAAAVLEVGGSWRTLETVGVLGAWAVVGLLVTPVVLRRMARRTSGSQVEAARDAALQWVR